MKPKNKHKMTLLEVLGMGLLCIVMMGLACMGGLALTSSNEKATAATILAQDRMENGDGPDRSNIGTTVRKEQ